MSLQLDAASEILDPNLKTPKAYILGYRKEMRVTLMDELLSLDDICEQLGDAEAGESVTTTYRAVGGRLQQR